MTTKMKLLAIFSFLALIPAVFLCQSNPLMKSYIEKLQHDNPQSCMKCPAIKMNGQCGYIDGGKTKICFNGTVNYNFERKKKMCATVALRCFAPRTFPTKSAIITVKRQEYVNIPCGAPVPDPMPRTTTTPAPKSCDNFYNKQDFVFERPPIINGFDERVHHDEPKIGKPCKNKSYLEGTTEGTTSTTEASTTTASTTTTTTTEEPCEEEEIEEGSGEETIYYPGENILRGDRVNSFFTESTASRKKRENYGLDRDDASFDAQFRTSDPRPPHNQNPYGTQYPPSWPFQWRGQPRTSPPIHNGNGGWPQGPYDNGNHGYYPRPQNPYDNGKKTPQVEGPLVFPPHGGDGHNTGGFTTDEKPSLPGPAQTSPTGPVKPAKIPQVEGPFVFPPHGGDGHNSGGFETDEKPITGTSSKGPIAPKGRSATIIRPYPEKNGSIFPIQVPGGVIYNGTFIPHKPPVIDPPTIGGNEVDPHVGGDNGPWSGNGYPGNGNGGYPGNGNGGYPGNGNGGYPGNGNGGYPGNGNGGYPGNGNGVYPPGSGPYPIYDDGFYPGPGNGPYGPGPINGPYGPGPGNGPYGPGPYGPSSGNGPYGPTPGSGGDDGIRGSDDSEDLPIPRTSQPQPLPLNPYGRGPTVPEIPPPQVQNKLPPIKLSRPGIDAYIHLTCNEDAKWEVVNNEGHKIVGIEEVDCIEYDADLFEFPSIRLD